MSGISTHILDTEKGKPAPGVRVMLERYSVDWEYVNEERTDDNGRIGQMLPPSEDLHNGLYRLTFRVDGTFFPEITIAFRVTDASSHYHVPLLLSPYGYTTYRGS